MKVQMNPALLEARKEKDLSTCLFLSLLNFQVSGNTRQVNIDLTLANHGKHAEVLEYLKEVLPCEYSEATGLFVPDDSHINWHIPDVANGADAFDKWLANKVL